MLVGPRPVVPKTFRELPAVARQTVDGASQPVQVERAATSVGKVECEAGQTPVVAKVSSVPVDERSGRPRSLRPSPRAPVRSP